MMWALPPYYLCILTNSNLTINEYYLYIRIYVQERREVEYYSEYY